MKPSSVKALQVARIAKEHGWHGRIDAEPDGSEAVLTAHRQDEQIELCWNHSAFKSGHYKLFGYTAELSCSAAALERIQGWPDVLKMLKQFPLENKVDLVTRYRRLPFDWQTASDDEIIANLVGRKITWYSPVSTRLRSEVVMRPKRKQHMEIKPVGHRKMFNFIGAQQGFTSVLLDSLIKVG